MVVPWAATPRTILSLVFCCFRFGIVPARSASKGNPQNATRYRISPEFTTNHTKYTNKENANEEIVRGVAFRGFVFGPERIAHVAHGGTMGGGSHPLSVLVASRLEDSPRLVFKGKSPRAG